MLQLARLQRLPGGLDLATAALGATQGRRRLILRKGFRDDADRSRVTVLGRRDGPSHLRRRSRSCSAPWPRRCPDRHRLRLPMSKTSAGQANVVSQAGIQLLAAGAAPGGGVLELAAQPWRKPCRLPYRVLRHRARSSSTGLGPARATHQAVPPAPGLGMNGRRRGVVALGAALVTNAPPGAGVRMAAAGGKPTVDAIGRPAPCRRRRQGRTSRYDLSTRAPISLRFDRRSFQDHDRSTSSSRRRSAASSPSIGAASAWRRDRRSACPARQRARRVRSARRARAQTLRLTLATAAAAAGRTMRGPLKTSPDQRPCRSCGRILVVLTIASFLVPRSAPPAKQNG